MTVAALAQMRQRPAHSRRRRTDRSILGGAGTGGGCSDGRGRHALSSAPIKTGAAEGRATGYAFRDITKLRVSQAPATPGGSIRGGGLPPATISTVTIDLERTAAGTAADAAHAR
jgi:hypothetical protein